MSNTATLLLGLAFVAGAIGGPLSNWETDSITQCATRCPEMTKFAYEGGKTYEYDYSSDLKTWVNGASEEHSSLHMAATVELTVATPCEFTMKLTDVSLQDSNPTDLNQKEMVARAWEFKRSMQEHPLRFGFLDGHVEHICPSQEEQTWVLNIKRGVLSALQNTMPTLESSVRQRETDISGDCPVEYDLEAQSWGVKKIRKTKSVLGCTDNHSHLTSFQASPYRVDSNIQSLPLLKTTHECQQEVNKEGLLTKTVCQEKHVFRPFSNGDNGAITQVDYTLQFKREANAQSLTVLEPLSSRASLVYDHTPTEAEIEENFRAAQKTLATICRNTREDIRPETPGLFASLVRELRVLDSDSLNTIHQRTSHKQPCAQADRFFHDAIPTLGSPASVRLIRDLILSGHLSELELDVWVTSMAFFPKPTLEMVKDTLPLLQMQPAQSKVVLAVSALAHSYCLVDTNCGETREVQEMVRILEASLGYDCRANDPAAHQMVLMSLKALGNLGVASRAVETLSRCVSTPDVTMELRVAAVNSFRRMDCAVDRNPLMQIFLDTREDSELRINAYLAVMACPSGNVISEVKRMLNNEQVNQVGSFVWTHMTNLQQTSNPHKQAIREILEDQTFQKVFDIDKRKFSRNLEWSLFSETLNAGGMVESNMIWSTESFVPRSSSVNLTVDMFGHSFNLMEFGGRVEGIDSILEEIFASDKDNNVPGRGKRETVSDNAISVLDNMFQKTRSEPQASYFMRIFGNEIRYGDFHGMSISDLKEKLNFLDWLIELSKEHSYDFTHSLMFLDTTMTIPTGTGMPLRLSVDGTATINMKVSGKMDIRQLFSSPSATDISGRIEPSGAIEINSEMTVDAFVTRAGLRMRSTMHSSTATNGVISLKDGQVFNVDVNIPQEKIEVFSAESKFFVLYRDEERPQTMLQEGSVIVHECFRGSFVKATGMDACVDISLPRLSHTDAPFFPFTAPAKFALSMNKKDTFENYHFEFKVVPEKERHVASLSFDTPGSRVDRKITADYNMDFVQKTVTLDMRSPWKKMNMNGGIVNTEALKKVEGRCLIDDTTEYSFLAELPKEGNTFTPTIRLSMPNKRPVSLTGTVTHIPYEKLQGEMRIDNVFTSPVILSSDISRTTQDQRTKIEVLVNLNSGIFNTKVTGQLSEDREGAGVTTASLSLEHEDSRRQKHHWSVNGKLREQENANRMTYRLDGDWDSSTWPTYNGNIDLDLQRTPRSLTTSMDVGFGGDRRFKFSKTSNYHLNGPSKTLDTTISAELPSLAWKREVTVNHMHSENELRSKIAYSSNPPKETLFEIKLKKESMNPLKASAQVNMVYPGREISWDQTIEETQPKVYEHNLRLQLEKYETIVLTSTYKMEPRHELTAELSIPAVTPIKFSGYLKPELRDLQARAEIQMEQMYAIGTNLKFNGKPTAFDASSDFEIVHPSKTISFTGSLNRNFFRYITAAEAKWDAVNYPEKKLTVNADLKMKMDSPDMKIKLGWVGNNYFNIDASGAYETEGWVNTKKDIHGKVDIRSTVLPSDISTSFRHDWSRQGMDSYGEFSLGNKKYTTSYNMKKGPNWKAGEHEIDITTPHQGFRSMKMLTSYNFNRKIEFSESFEWDNKKIEAAVTGSFTRNKLDGSVTFKSPFAYYEDLYANMMHTLDDAMNCNSNMEVSWARNQKINTKLTMQHSRQGFFITNNGGLSVTTPFESFRQTSVTWKHMNNAAKWECEYVVEKDGQKSTLTLDAGDGTNGGIRSLTGRAMFTSPFENMRQLTMDLTHSHRTNSWESIATEGTFRWNPRAYINYKHDISVRPFEMLKVESRMTTPFRTMPSLNLNLDMQKSGNSFTAENEFIWANRKMTLGGSVTAALPAFQANMRFTSPFELIDRITMNVNNVKQGETWKSHADFEMTDIELIEIDSLLAMGRVNKFGLDIKSPITYIQALSFDSTVKGGLRNFNIKSSLEHNLLASKITLMAISDTEDLTNMKVTLNFHSPFAAVRSIRGTASHKVNGARYNSDMLFQLPGYRTTASHDMTVNSVTDFTTSSVVEYVAGQRIQLNSEFKMNPAIKAQVTFTSPFQNFEKITVNVEHEGNLMGFASSGELSYAPQAKITTSANFNIRGTRVSGSARLTTPFSPISRVTVNFNHQGRLNNFKNDASFELNEKTVTIDNEFSVTSPNLKVLSRLTTPFSGYEAITLDLSHNGPLNSFDNKFNLDIAGRIISVTSKFDMVHPNVDGQFTLQTPYHPLRKVEIVFNHDAKKWTNFENSGSLTINRNTYSGSSQMRLFKTNMVSSIKINIPEEYGFETKFRGTPDDHTSNLKLIIADRSSMMNSNYKNDESGLESGLAIETPYAGYETFSSAIQHTGGRSNFKTTGHVETPFSGYRRFAGEVSHSGNMQNFRSTGSLDTPFESVPRITITLEHNGEMRQFASKVSVLFKENTYEGDVNFGMTDDEISGAVGVITPIANWEKTAVSFAHTSTVRGCTTAVEVVTSFPGYESFKGDLSLSGRLRNGMVDLKVETSIPKYELFKWTLNHRSNYDHISTSSVLTTSIPGFARFAIEISHDHSDTENIRSSASLETPIAGYERFSYNVEHTGSMQKFKTSGNILTPFDGHDNFNFNIDHGSRRNGFRCSVKISTTYFDDLDFSIDHTGDRRDFRTSSTVTLPFRSLRTVTVSANHRGHLMDFNSGGSVIYDNNKVEMSVLYQQSNRDWRNADYITAFSLTTPNPRVTDFKIDATHSRTNPLKTGKMEIVHNGDKVFDVDYDYTIGKHVNTRVTLRQPYSMESLVNYEKMENAFNSDSTFKWDTTDRSKQVRFDINMKNQKDSYSTDRMITFITTLPTRVIGVTTAYTKQPDSFKHSGTWQWNSGDSNKVSYDVEVADRSRRSQKTYEGTLNIRSRPYTGTVTVNHNYVPNRQYTTEVAIQSFDRLVIRNELTMNNPSFSNKITIEHPKLSNDATFEVTGSYKPSLIEGEIKANVERDSFNLGGQIVRSPTASSGRFNLKHPGSLTDLQWTGEWTDDERSAAVTTSFEYMMSRDNQRKIMSLKADIDKIRKSFDIETITPVKSVRVVGSMPTDNSVSITGTSGSNSVSADVMFNRADRTFEATIKLNPYEAIMLSGQFTEPRAMRLEASRQKNGATINDVAIAYDLLSDNVLTGRVFVRPGLFENIKNYFTNIEVDFSELTDLAPILAEEMKLTANYMARSARPMTGMIFYVTEAVTTPFEEVSTIWNEMFRRNEFHVRDATVAFRKSYNTYKREASKVYRRAYHQTIVFVQPYMDKAEAKMTEMNGKIEELKIAANAKLAELKIQGQMMLEKMTTHYDMLKSSYQPHLDTLHQKVGEYSALITKKYREMVDRVRNDPRFAEYKQILATLTPETLVQMIQENKPALWQQYRLAEVWDNVKDWSVLSKLQTYYNQGFEKTQYMYNKYVKNIVDQLYNGGVDYASSKVMEKANALLHFDQDRWTIWDPEAGRFGFQVFVPMDLLSKIPKLPELPDIDVGEYMDQVQDFVSDYIPDEMPCLSDIYYKYRPSSDYKNWVPPFKSHAVLAGSQHYMTFDKRFYEFTGQCSYLLARDFIDGTFSVVVNYHRPSNSYTKKSITVITGEHQFEIFPNSKVLMDGDRQVEMPLQIGSTSVLRLRNSIRVDNDNGLTVICDLPSDRCTVNVTGWYFAKTGGLLGTYNNEPMDDFVSPSRTIAPSVEQFADSWTVGTKCQLENYAIDLQVSPESPVHKMCAKYFIERDSIFRPCFGVVEPEPFMRMCINENANSNSILSEKDLCNVISFYNSECKSEGVIVKSPSVCVQCEKPDNTGYFFEGEEMSLTLDDDTVPQSADVVFVVQHSDCTESVMNQLDDMAEKIYKQFKSNNMKEVLFSLIGFGGRGMQSMPHVHTLAGQIFNTWGHIRAAARAFDKVGGDEDDVMAAIQFAATLPFRTGAAKSIVLITCDAKACEYPRMNYDDVQEMLLDQDIRFHYMMEHSFQAESKNDKNQILGVTNDCVHSHKKLPCRLRSGTPMPENKCAELAADTDGSIFDINTWVTGRPKNAAKFVKVFVKVIADKGTPADCQVCECRADDDGVGISICSRCLEEELPVSEDGDKFEVTNSGEVIPEGKFQAVKRPRAINLKSKRGKGKGKGNAKSKTGGAKRVAKKRVSKAKAAGRQNMN